MFCSPADLKTESDVEQKFLYPLLTTGYPNGLEYSPAEILTKLSIRRLEIGKGTARKLYYPDYLVLMSGLPSLVVEAKSPSEDVLTGLDEARLYAAEINALFPASMNPCELVVASNGVRLLLSTWDSAGPLLDISVANVTPGAQEFAKFVELVRRKARASAAARIRTATSKKDRVRPLNIIGGQTVRNEQIGQNSFGAKLNLEYGHIFNPTSPSERAYVVKNAYIRSVRRERFVEPIDRLIRGVVSPVVSEIDPLEDTSKPREITDAFTGNIRSLESKLVLLVGSVGSGKSTFVDYLTQVALPEDVLQRTVWIRINLNTAPPIKELAHSWLAEQLIAGLRETRPDVDFDSLPMLRKVYGLEVRALLKGPLSLLDEHSDEYKRRLADKLIELQGDAQKTAKCLARYLCLNAGKLLVVCLDNCDKRGRDEQLLMFQLAQWLQTEMRCLVFLPLRDVTYDAHRHEPPLDTAIKNLTFRIEPPRFSDVLAQRVQLALADLRSRAKERTIEYTLPNGMRVEYPASDQGMYLSAIVRSLYAHDRFVRRIMSGLAGRDIRKAIEIFLEFCTSGHIGEDQIYKIRTLEGQHTIPFEIVARVLLRMNRRFYDGDKSYIKNLFQCEPSDAMPDHFVRLSILRFLEQHLKEPGPTGVHGFHRVTEVVAALSRAGHDSDRVRQECQYLLRERCITAEHQRQDILHDDDQVSLSPSGAVHLSLTVIPDFLAACAEDIWFSSRIAAQIVADKIGKGGPVAHYARRTIRQNAKTLIEYLESERSAFSAQNINPTSDTAPDYIRLDAMKAGLWAPQVDHARLFIGNLNFSTTENDLKTYIKSKGLSAVDVHLLTDKTTGRSRGAAFVSMDTPTNAVRAIDELDGSMLNERKLDVDHAETPAPSRRSNAAADSHTVDPKRIVLMNLPFDTSVEDVVQFLKTKGLRPTDVYIPRKESGASRGMAFVEFASDSESTTGITMTDGGVIRGRAIRAAPAFAKPRGTRRTQPRA